MCVHVCAHVHIDTYNMCMCMYILVYISVWCIYKHTHIYKEIYFKGLLHMIVGAGESEICCVSGRLETQQDLMLQT